MKRDTFFFGFNVLLLFIVLVGFAPSFYLRPVSKLYPLPLYLIIHGLSCTAWFVVIVLQSYLVRSGRLVQHRTYGTYFSLLAPVLVLSGYAVIAYAVDLYHVQFPPTTSEVDMESERAFRALLIVGDAVQLIIYLLFVYLGYRYRSHVPFHKRAMLIASIIICQQALVRLGKFELLMIGDDPGASGGLYATFIPVIMLLSLWVYDFRLYKKLQKISVLGLVSYIAFVAIAIVIHRSGVGLAWIESLR